MERSAAVVENGLRIGQDFQRAGGIRQRGIGAVHLVADNAGFAHAQAIETVIFNKEVAVHGIVRVERQSQQSAGNHGAEVQKRAADRTIGRDNPYRPVLLGHKETHVSGDSRIGDIQRLVQAGRQERKRQLGRALPARLLRRREQQNEADQEA